MENFIFDAVFQIVTEINTKSDSYFVAKCDKSLLQKNSGFFYKLRQFYYKCNGYYKMQRLY